ARPQVAGTSTELRGRPARLLARSRRPPKTPERQRVRSLAAPPAHRADRRGAQDERGQVRQEGAAGRLRHLTHPPPAPCHLSRPWASGAWYLRQTFDVDYP